MTAHDRGGSRVGTRMLDLPGMAVGLMLVLVLAPAGHVRAQTVPAAEASAPTGAARTADPALWIIRDADSTLHLFGTVHFLRPSTVWESSRVKAAFEASDVLVLEVADPSDQSAVMPLVQQYGISPDRPLSSVLSEAELARLDEAARALGADAAQLDGLRPWLAGVTLAAAVLLRAGYEPGSGADMILRERAVAAGKPVVGLETTEEQVRMLAGFPEEGQLAFLRRTLADYDNAMVTPDRLVEAWAAGDVDTIEALAVETLRKDSELAYQRLLAERNARWADRIEEMLEGSGTVFIAVGILHLAGDDSVQAILRSRGIEVTAIR